MRLANIDSDITRMIDVPIPSKTDIPNTCMLLAFINHAQTQEPITKADPPAYITCKCQR